MREPFRKQGNPQTKARWADLSEDQETEEVHGVSEVTAPPIRDSGVGVLDTACRMSVSGSAWLDDYKSKLADLGLLDYVKEEPERERYRFGDGRIVKSYKKATLPIVMCGQPLLATCSIVESDTLGLLLGKDFQEHNKVDMSIWRKEVRIGSGRTGLLDSSAGHPSVDLRPQLWKSLKETQDYVRADDDLPRALRPRARSGPPKPQRLLPEKRRGEVQPPQEGLEHSSPPCASHHLRHPVVRLPA